MKKFNISGVIGWDVTADDLRHFLQRAGGDAVELLVSSPGGLVGEALEMYNLVRNYGGRTTAVLSGFAMSAASYIPLAADEILVEDNAVYMIHNVHGGVWGDHNYILKYGNETKALSKLLSGAYVRRTGIAGDEIRTMMDEETFFYGAEIVEQGFADSLVETGSDSDRENILTTARMALKDCGRKVAEAAQMAADDWSRAVALAGKVEFRRNNDRFQPKNRQTKKQTNRAATPTRPQRKEHSMDLKTLKKEHPDLVAALKDEFSAALTVEALAADSPETYQAVMEAGRAAEVARIQDVRAQAIDGHEELIASLELDGKSTGADAAKAIIAAERELRAQAGRDLDQDANDPVDPASPDSGGKKEIKRAEFNQLSVAAQRDFVADGGVIKD